MQWSQTLALTPALSPQGEGGAGEGCGTTHLPATFPGGGKENPLSWGRGTG